MKKIGLLFLLLLLFVSGYGKETKTKPGASEMKEYQGEKLSSINDFRENSIKGPQKIDKEKYRLKITGLVENPLIYTYDELIQNHQSLKKVVELNCVEGWSVNILWEGILVRDLLNQANIKKEAKVVIFHSVDGYSTSFPLNYFYKNDIIIAYKMNDLILPPERGFPFELVAEGKWGYKWIKWIIEIELSDDLNYKGYWEKLGYSNSGNLEEDFFEK